MDAKDAIKWLRPFREGSSCSWEALDLAIAALEREHAERWRSVEEEVPGERISVLVTCIRNGIKEVAESFRDDGAWYIDEDILGPVIAWRPLPEPAKEQEASRG